MADPRQVVFTLDHNVQDTSDANLAKYADIAAFAKGMGVDAYPAGRGIGHQVMCEEGYAYPFRMVVASDSHSNMYGGLGCLGTPVVRTDAACIWATGQTWWKVPKTALVELNGQLPPGVTGKDVIVTLCGVFKNDEVLNHAVEFSGTGLQHLSIDDRLTIANMTTEWGALAGVFAIDDVTLDWLAQRTRYLNRRGLPGVPSDADADEGVKLHPRCDEAQLAAARAAVTGMDSDFDAHYAVTIKLDLASVRPHVSGPNNVKTMTSVAKMAAQKIEVDKAYLVSCVNSRLEDLAAAADVVRGKQVASHVELYVAAASDEVMAESKAAGNWQTLMDAGAIPLPPGCGPCIGLGKGLLEPGEVAISATNRNFKGRMGAASAEAYLASPVVVAASAIAGHITGPDDDSADPAAVNLVSSIEYAHDTGGGGGGVTAATATSVEPGFPESVRGRVVYCPDNDINTDGMYPGKYTYQDMPEAEMAKVVMENYDTGFAVQVVAGDVLVVGENFGTGSSREQAATALKFAGISAVLCASVNQTYQRNAINNGLIVLEVPDLVAAVRAAVGAAATPGEPAAKTIIPDCTIDMCFVTGKVTLAGPLLEAHGGFQSFGFQTLGAVCQQIIALGGLNGFIAEKLNDTAEV